MTTHITTLADLVAAGQLQGKRVFIRSDLNVPLSNGEITEDTRIKASLPAIRMALDAGAAVMVTSHLGRPKEGIVMPEDSLAPVAERLSKMLALPVPLRRDWVDGVDVEPGHVVMLENCRCNVGEKANDIELSKKMAALCDVFVNDAFGTAHRAHASNVGISDNIDVAVAGFLLEKEIKFIGGTLENPERPFVAILGGAKVSDKIEVINNLLKVADTVLIGGGMAFTFYKAMGYEIGKSLLEEDKVELAKELLEKANGKIVLGSDVTTGKAFSNDTEVNVREVDSILKDEMGLDIGPKSIKEFSEIIKNAKTVVWNGPMGVFEMSNFAKGTIGVAKAIADNKDHLTSIVGGGDSAAAVIEFGLEDGFSHISTGGGASLEYLEGKELPGIVAVKDK